MIWILRSDVGSVLRAHAHPPTEHYYPYTHYIYLLYITRYIAYITIFIDYLLNTENKHIYSIHFDFFKHARADIDTHWTGTANE